MRATGRWTGHTLELCVCVGGWVGVYVCVCVVGSVLCACQWSQAVRRGQCQLRVTERCKIIMGLAMHMPLIITGND
jgi:hypothetical protein